MGKKKRTIEQKLDQAIIDLQMKSDKTKKLEQTIKNELGRLMVEKAKINTALQILIEIKEGK